MRAEGTASSSDVLRKFNAGLRGMREIFHQTGRLEDSNAKLDEVAKLLCLEVVSVKDSDAGIPGLAALLERHADGSGLVRSLNHALKKAATSALLTNYDGESLLGSSPKFAIAESEAALALGLTRVVLESFNGYLREPQAASSFDLLNEAFGHFVRDNFRQNTEDAQYMTPPEAVDYMVTLGIKALEARKLPSTHRPIICDPTCGVGSFLAQFNRLWQVGTQARPEPILVGQDKVDRMARLSRLNLTLFDLDASKVSRGNSLLPESPLDAYAGKCDLILTNPPFGARFSSSELGFHSMSFFPLLHDIIHAKSSVIDSELLLLDRYLTLLRGGGTVLAVLPDSVVSASGVPAQLRGSLHQDYYVRSVTELPAVTFAQAGTRTKTCIVEIVKTSSRGAVFMSKVSSIGYKVRSRKGVPYKLEDGTNELPALADTLTGSYSAAVSGSRPLVLSTAPSCVAVVHKTLSTEGWTPSHYSAERLTALSLVSSLEAEDHEILSLADLVSVGKRERHQVDAEGVRCISVLHVGDLGYINLRELADYAPKTPGVPCAPGDVLFSRINPRIPRAAVVPDLPYELTCSSEFEVMRPKKGYDAYEVMLLLLGDLAQRQIQSLTSGTSSSHNRIKTKELLSVKVAVPRRGTKARGCYDAAVKDFRRESRALTKHSMGVVAAWQTMDSTLPRGSMATDRDRDAAARPAAVILWRRAS